MSQVVMGSPGGGENKCHRQSLEGSASSRNVMIPGLGNEVAMQNHRRQETLSFIDEGVERTIDWPMAELIRAGQSRGGPQF